MSARPSPLWSCGEALISDATLLRFDQGRLFHISQLSETQTLKTRALIDVLRLRDGRFNIGTWQLYTSHSQTCIM